MPKLTLLAITQEILSEMDSDNVNSITDTEEAIQVTTIIKSCFYEIISAKHHKHYDRMLPLEAGGSSIRPTYMRLPEEVVDVHWIKYNDKDISYSDPETFMDNAIGLASNYETQVDFEGITFKVGNDKDPTSWTSFDEEYIVFNSYDSSVESTLQQSNSRLFAYTEPSFTISDTFIPDMPLQMFPQLVAEAKSTAFAHIKQMPSQKAEQKASRQRRRLSTQSRVNNGIVYPGFGR